MGDKADWSDTFVRHLFDACKEEIEAGNRPLGVFTTQGWKNVVSKFNQKSGGNRTKKQLKNKLDVFKKEYSMFMEFKNCATGLGWDEAKQTIVCSEEWWDEHLARCNNSTALSPFPGATFSTEHERVREDRFWPYFKDAIGAIDGSHIQVIVPLDETIAHTCRHGYTSQNVLAICDFDMRFTFAVPGWPGSAHDSRILSHALANFPSFPMPPKGKYYLVDSGYANRIGYLAPYKGTTYHIPEFRHRSGPPQGKYENFNFLHSSLRNVIERSLGVLKQKWRILKGIPSFSTKTQKHIIIACLALHNFIRESKLRDKEFERCDANEVYLPRRHRRQPNEVTDEENDEDMNIIRTRIADALISGMVE